MIHELSFDQIDHVNGAGEIGDAIRAVGEVGAKIVETAYDAGYMLGKAVGDLFR
jgi:hypothetical protein